MTFNNKVWVLKSKGEQSAFGGNSGYADNPESKYVYDTTVKNHNRLNEGDLVIVAGKKYIFGFARITSIDSIRNVEKIRYRCPICHTQEHYSRKDRTPKYRCRAKHEFEAPEEENIKVEEFTANYGSTFMAASPKTSVKLLEPYYLNRNLYYSIQQADPTFFDKEIPSVLTAFHNNNGRSGLLPFDITVIPAYKPTHSDDRERTNRHLPTRKGQAKFKSDLINIYGSICMITGCSTSIVIEASHVYPYRGNNDNNPYNGLLLRADLHKLFDADLIGIDPQTFTIELHPSIENNQYRKLKGKKLRIKRKDFSPCLEALEYRWEIFKNRQ
jgi:putative restriction endonuclease